VGFTSSAWARDGFVRLVGIDPFPGTLNLTVAEGPERDAWRRLQEEVGIIMAAPDPAWCDAVLFPVMVNDRERGAIVLPRVASYDPGQVEIIAPVHLRGALGLVDGDPVAVRAAAVGGG
jgi:CTP-dependent riboflavin kinase